MIFLKFLGIGNRVVSRFLVPILIGWVKVEKLKTYIIAYYQGRSCELTVDCDDGFILKAQGRWHFLKEAVEREGPDRIMNVDKKLQINTIMKRNRKLILLYNVTRWRQGGSVESGTILSRTFSDLVSSSDDGAR